MNKAATILIIEDEPIIADDIAMILEKNGYQISSIEDNSLDALDHLEQNNVDLVLLDINIEGDRDGIWLAHQIKKQYEIPRVFLTSYYDRKTLERAKETGPSGYIVKPYDEGDLVANITLALVKNDDRQVSESDKFFVRDKGELKAIETVDILYAESDNNYTNIYTLDRKFVVTHTLKSVEEKLIGKGFIRSHKSYLVNFQKVNSISEGYVFIDQTKLPIGRTYRDALVKDLPIL